MVKKISDLQGLITMVKCETLNQYKALIRILNLYGWKPSNTFVDNFAKYPVIYIHKDVGYTALERVIPVTGYTAVGYAEIIKAYGEERKDFRLATIRGQLTLLAVTIGDKETYDKCLSVLSLGGLEAGYVSEYDGGLKHHILIKNGRYSSVCADSVVDREPLSSADIISAGEFLKVNLN